MFPAQPLATEGPAARRLGMGVVVSVLLHAGGAVMLAWAPGGADASGLRLPEPDPARPRPTPEVRPGVERSSAVSVTWLGFSDPTPHEAPLSETEQAAMSPAPASRAAEPAPPVPPSPTALASEAPRPAVPAEPGAPRGGGIDAPRSPEAELPDQPPAPQLAAAPSPRPLPEQTAPQAADEAESTRVPTSRAEIAEAPSEPRTPSPAGTPGEVADKEATAASTRPPIRVEPGRPVAAEGLDIKTVRPRWTTLTRLTIVPKNPLVLVRFNKAGVVARAELTRSSGSSQVDGPLLDSIYLWRASGRALEELSDAPDAGVELNFEMLLRRGG